MSGGQPYELSLACHSQWINQSINKNSLIPQETDFKTSTQLLDILASSSKDTWKEECFEIFNFIITQILRGYTQLFKNSNKYVE